MTRPHRPAPLWLLVTLQAVVSAASLVVEIVAGRMIAPYVGMSLYTWTAVIAVVLAGFSAGHWWGGRIAERETGPALRVTGWAMLGAAVTTGGAVLLLRQVAGPVLEGLDQPLAAITLLAAAVFFLPSFFAGVPAPVLSIVAIRAGGRSGHALGAMFASGAIGAIAGTLLAGFLFISWLGAALTLATVTACYGVVAAMMFRLAAAGPGLPALAALAGALGLAGGGLALPRICDAESQYFCIRTVELEPGDPGAVRLMVLDHLAHGISGRDDPTLAYTEHSAMLDGITRMRMQDRRFHAFFIGGGSYSVPRIWAARGAGVVTVAEIDPEVTRIAASDFWFDPQTTQVIHQDARRALLLRPELRFDVVVGDAFTDIAVPAHLVTREFFELVRDRLVADGIYVMTVIDHADRLEALAAIVATLREVFPAVEVWTEMRPPEPGERRVFALVAGQAQSPVDELALRAPEPRSFAPLDDRFIDGLLADTAPTVLTDDYAPIDRLVGLGTLLD
ncbi:fused MFS/spermidine synthase [Rhodovulum euryhalinum]|uniref:Spermidine synthase n=1 Tax=Rhodovulum euryhalinum TaxID=35805 RepID=A0A4R2KIQ6_9RHOB|nr:fused MFS/spermidine synthase [Rhodovulum euryhalinum]TCO72372.1 spermidine synthase [Rhodovulum euryhalinum]